MGCIGSIFWGWTMAVITISREFGSEGSLVAEKTARALGYHLADKQTLEAILRTEGALPEFQREYASVPGFWDRFDLRRMERRQGLIESLNRAILALAQHGNMVIVGRGGFSVLKGLADVFHVRIQAPLPVRIRRVTELPEAAVPSRAERFILENDKIQRGFIESVYGVPWDTAKHFDLVLDTGKIAPDLAAGWLVQAVQAMPGGGFTAAGLEVDPVFAARVNGFFHCEAHAA